MSESTPKNELTFIIPPEIKKYCDKWLLLLKEKNKNDSSVTSETLQRMIDYYEQNQEALLHNVIYQLKTNPKYLGTTPENVNRLMMGKTQKAVSNNQPKKGWGINKKTGPTEQKIIDGLDDKSSLMTDENFLKKVEQEKSIKGSKLQI